MCINISIHTYIYTTETYFTFRSVHKYKIHLIKCIMTCTHTHAHTQFIKTIILIQVKFKYIIQYCSLINFSPSKTCISEVNVYIIYETFIIIKI